jgi:hypothetical protein
MRARLADRIGLAGTGLVDSGLSVRHARTWVERVRAGGLTPTESAATLVLVYRLWLVALLFKALGSGWDVAWHFRWLRDDFAPPHNVNLLGDAIAIALVLFHVHTRFGVDRLALRLMVGGLGLFIASAPIDVINHRLNGLDITSWSLTHFGLYTGTAILIAGAIRGWATQGAAGTRRPFVLGALWFFFLENVLFPNQHQEYGVAALAAWDRGEPTAEPSLLQFAAEQIGRPVDRVAVEQFALPVPAWVYPVWIVGAAMLTLLLARRSVGLRWTATAVAGAYVAWRCVLWPLLVAGGFPTSAVPFLLLAGAVVIDLICLLGLPWPAEAAAGAALVTAAVYLTGYAQSVMLVAPPISYWSAPAAAGVLLLAWGTFAYLRERR